MSRNNYGLDMGRRRDEHGAVCGLRTIDFREVPDLGLSLRSGGVSLAAVCLFDKRHSNSLERSVLPLFASRERARFESLRNSGARAQYLASRLLAKTMVGVADALPATSIETAHAPDGSFVVRGTRVQYHASIAHTPGAAALVLSAAIPVGIDIERLRKPPLAVARRYFSEDEYRMVEGAPDPSAAFFRLWTLKESLAKLEGAGVIESLRKYEFALDGEKVSLGTGGGGAAGSFRFESVMLEHHVLGMAFGDPGVTAALVRPVRCGELLRYAGQS